MVQPAKSDMPSGSISELKYWRMAMAARKLSCSCFDK